MTVAGSGTLIGMISPAFGDAGTGPTMRPSAIFYNGSDTNLNATICADGTQAGSNAGKTSTGYGSLAPIRPYQQGTSGAAFRLVSYGLRMRYTGTALNANGTLKYLPNDLGAMELGDGPYSTILAVKNYIDGNAHTIMRSIYDKAVYDFNGLGSTEWMRNDEIYPAVHDEGGQYGVGSNIGVNHWTPVYIGQNDSQVMFGTPGMLLSYTNNSASTVQFEVELVENWEVRTATNTPFHTDSHGNPEISQEVFRTVVSGHMHAAASSAPTVVNSLKAVNAASKSPLGKLVIAAALS